MDRCFRITDEDIDELRDSIRDQQYVAAWVRWRGLCKQIDGIVDEITLAFADTKLGDGIGLFEASGLDDYASCEELAELRAKDEKNDWRRISTDSLNRCYASPAFFDPRGFVFHLPAFLIAELNDQHGYGFIDRLIEFDRQPTGWIDMLTDEQKNVIIKVLKLITQHPEYCHKSSAITSAIARYCGSHAIDA